MDEIANGDDLSSAIVDLRDVFFSFSYEKLRSPDTTVTGIVKRIPCDDPHI